MLMGVVVDATGQLSELLEGQPTIGSAEQNENPIHSVESLKLPCPFSHFLRILGFLHRNLSEFKIDK